MKFNVVVMQINGSITDRGQQSFLQLRSTELGQRLISGYRMMLDEGSARSGRGFKESIPFRENDRDRLKWWQITPYVAMAHFIIGGQFKFSWFYLADHEPDNMVATASFQQVVEGMGTRMRVPVTVNFKSQERPLAICVPWPPSADETSRQIVSHVAVCLGAAFFERGEELRKLNEPAPAGAWDLSPSEN